MENPRGSPLRRLQNRLQSILGVALPLFHARGVFQYSFGLMPYRKPINTVVGEPIPLVRNPSPAQGHRGSASDLPAESDPPVRAEQRKIRPR
ncbi:hypothetical protein KUCAC02_034789 [Chaenocephalus aceratus]|nr:hypothetical protein KUCAC02_034789 [Chaenocephalus aceratus]